MPLGAVSQVTTSLTGGNDVSLAQNNGSLPPKQQIHQSCTTQSIPQEAIYTNVIAGTNLVNAESCSAALIESIINWNFIRVDIDRIGTSIRQREMPFAPLTGGWCRSRGKFSRLSRGGKMI